MIELEKRGIQCSLLPPMDYRNFFALPTFSFIKSIDADIFVSSNPAYGLLGASIAKKMGRLKYLVFRLKGDYWTEYKSRNAETKYGLSGYLKKLENLLSINNVDFILAISNWIRKKAERKGLKNIYTLYNGVDCMRFRPRPPDWRYRSQLLCVMNFNISQKISKLCDFLKEYKNRKLSYHITFLGDGFYFNSVRKYVSHLGLDKLIKFKGRVNNIEYYYSGCDVVIHPSGLEAFGMVLLEAGASSKPVVATKVGGIPEIIIDGKTGFLTNDPSRFIDHIERLMEDEDLRVKMGLTARNRILQKFTWECVAEEFVKIINKEVMI